MKPVGWTAAAVVLAGVMTAWMDPSTGGLMHAGLLILAGIWAGHALIGRRDLPVHRMVLLPAAVALWGIIQIAFSWTVYPFETWNSVTAWLARAAVFLTAYAGFPDEPRRERLMTIAVWFGGAFSLLTLLQWSTGDGTIFWIIQTAYKSEVAGTFGNRDQYAAFMELLLPIALAATVGKRRSPVLPACCAGLMFASVIATGSRAGAIVVCLEALIFVVAACVGQHRNRRAAALIAASLIICTLIGGWGYVSERFSASDPFAYRREMLTATIDMIRARPLTGFGLGTWPSVYPAYAVFDPPGVFMNHAHNDWAEWMADGGAPLFGLAAAFACAVALRLRRSLWALGIPAVFAHALVDFPLQKPALACTLFFLAGVCLSVRARSPRSPAEPSSCEGRRL